MIFRLMIDILSWKCQICTSNEKKSVDSQPVHLPQINSIWSNTHQAIQSNNWFHWESAYTLKEMLCKLISCWDIQFSSYRNPIKFWYCFCNMLSLFSFCGYDRNSPFHYIELECESSTNSSFFWLGFEQKKIYKYSVLVGVRLRFVRNRNNKNDKQKNDFVN